MEMRQKLSAKKEIVVESCNGSSNVGVKGGGYTILYNSDQQTQTKVVHDVSQEERWIVA